MPAATISSTSPELMLADNSACVLIFMMALSLDSLYARSLSSISSAAASNTVHPWFAAISRSASAHHTPRHQLRLESGEHCAAKWDRPLVPKELDVLADHARRAELLDDRAALDVDHIDIVVIERVQGHLYVAEAKRALVPNGCISARTVCAALGVKAE